MGPGDLKPAALRRAGGDPAVVKADVLQLSMQPTGVLHEMLVKGIRIASLLGHMRWHAIHFRAPLLAYSDQPAVLWPAGREAPRPFPAPEFGPMTAVEIRIPVGPRSALLLTWEDAPSQASPLAGDSRIAAELNAFTVSQADRQWMHQPGTEPPIATGHQLPLSRMFRGPHAGQGIECSTRRDLAAKYLRQVGLSSYLDTVSVIADIS